IIARRSLRRLPSSSPNIPGMDWARGRDVRIRLVGATHPCHNPRLVREADTHAERGHDVRVVAVHTVPELVADDARLVASRRWRLQAASILRSPWSNRL